MPPIRYPVRAGKRQCSKCGDWKPATPEVFYRAPERAYGIRANCRECHRAAGSTTGKRHASPTRIVRGRKLCTTCKTWLPATTTHFFANPDVRSGLKASCKRCVAAGKRARYDRDSNARRSRAYRLRTRYGIAESAFQRLLKHQQGVCAICRREQHGAGTAKRLDIDHDAVSGGLRGLLCRRCNRTIGLLDHDPKRILRAAKYLEAVERAGHILRPRPTSIPVAEPNP